QGGDRAQPQSCQELCEIFSPSGGDILKFGGLGAGRTLTIAATPLLLALRGLILIFSSEAVQPLDVFTLLSIG
ncbi:hypothetical protein ACFDR9_004508, partial [Janthinobacterium sp. CG_23.3]|uniref:hypothetical protein n=1 Tax=Janthinobacterium sp. CG_23.3 TaxID=3349634 RepID=UPI0038D3B38C